MSYRVIKHAAVDANKHMKGTRNILKSEAFQKARQRIGSYLKGKKGNKSKYDGGFINGKNSPAYNHDYYIHNKDKWREHVEERRERLEETKKEIEAASHKYLYRIVVNGKYRYFYSDAEFSRYMLNVKRIEGEHDPFYDMNQVNPNYDTGKREYTYNCAWCTTAYDLRRRGYDVQAVASRSGNFNDDQSSLYVNKDGKHPSFILPDKRDITNATATQVRRDMVEELYSDISEYPNGARGYVSMTWSNDRGGHSMAFEKYNDTVYLIDSQTHRTYTEEEFIQKVSQDLSTNYTGPKDNAQFSSLRHMRVDDCELSEQVSNFEYVDPSWKVAESQGREIYKDVSGTPFISNGTHEATDDEKIAAKNGADLGSKNYIVPGGISGIEAFERTQNRRTGGRK